jgi:hypothetical protein
MIYQYRILHYYYYMNWFNKKMMSRYRKGTAEAKAQKALSAKYHTLLKQSYYSLTKLAHTRMRQLRARTAEWNLWRRWYAWGRKVMRVRVYSCVQAYACRRMRAYVCGVTGA